MDGEWISAARAYELVSTATPMRAAITICTRASDGLVSARAKRLVWGSEVRDDHPVPKEFWWARGHAALDQNWQSGDFETWIDQGIHCRAYSVEFLRADVEAMLPEREIPTMEPVSSSEIGFAPSRECLETLKSMTGCPDDEGKRVILRACRAGLVAGRCDSMWWRVTDRYGYQEFEDTAVAIPDWFWEHCVFGFDIVLNWQSGRFAGNGIIDSDHYKAILTGVEFRVADIVEIGETYERTPKEVGSSAPSALVGSAKEAQSGRRLSEKWRPWIAELVAYMHEEGLPEGVGSQGQEEVINAVADRLAARGEELLSRSAVQPTVQAVLDRLRGAEK